MQKSTLGVGFDRRFGILSGSHLQCQTRSENQACPTPHLTLKMTNAKVLETLVNIDNNSPSQDYTNLNDLHLQRSNHTPRVQTIYFTVTSVSLFFEICFV